jgi:hypothetical protein
LPSASAGAEATRSHAWRTVTHHPNLTVAADLAQVLQRAYSRVLVNKAQDLGTLQSA